MIESPEGGKVSSGHAGSSSDGSEERRPTHSRCPTCGTPNMPHRTKCEVCGAQLELTRSAPDEGQEEEDKEAPTENRLGAPRPSADDAESAADDLPAGGGAPRRRIA